MTDSGMVGGWERPVVRSPAVVESGESGVGRPEVRVRISGWCSRLIATMTAAVLELGLVF